MHAEADKRYKLPREGGTYSGNEALRQRWAFVNGAKWGAAEARAPLEERIRNLQRWAEIDHANLAAAEERIRGLEVHGSALAAVDGERIEVEAEVERLRKALRKIVGLPVPPYDCVTLYNSASDMWHTARRALATPPSSTEGTK